MDRLPELFRLYYNKTATPAEREEFMHLVQDASPAALADLIRESGEILEEFEQGLPAEKANFILASILGKSTADSASALHPSLKIHRIPFRRLRWWAAAAVLFLVTGGYLLFLGPKKGGSPVSPVAAKGDVNPGVYKASLTLADGSTIILDSAAPGQLSTQGNTVVVNKGGQLVYEPGAGSPESVIYNTVSTSKGETYSMTLADGSQIWLNSASSIRFPVAFPGMERRIEVTGEVYVLVAKNKAKPFIASANGMEVLALGTEFNINSYPDETGIHTTLIEGSVKVSQGSAAITLAPGQQSRFSGGTVSVNRQVNREEVIAWKDGWFHFENADLKTILRQMARWYDVEVVYEGPVKNRKFLAVVKRSSTLQTVLKLLRYNDIDFRIEGKKLIVQSG